MSAPFDAAHEAAKRAAQEMVDLYIYIGKQQAYNGFDRALMSDIRLIDATPEGTSLWELKLTDYYSNLNGVMHGGAGSVIFDMCSTTALCPIQKPGYWDFMGGVTRSLNISYLRAVPIPSTIHISSHVVQHGRTMALIRAVMTSPDGKTTYAACEHHKVHLPSSERHLNVREQMREAKKKLAREREGRGDRAEPKGSAKL